jgi:hypothetical protein
MEEISNLNTKKHFDSCKRRVVSQDQFTLAMSNNLNKVLDSM